MSQIKQYPKLESNSITTVWPTWCTQQQSSSHPVGYKYVDYGTFNDVEITGFRPFSANCFEKKTHKNEKEAKEHN